MPSDEVLLNTITRPKYHLAGIGLAGVGLGATAGDYEYKKDPQKDLGKAAQTGISGLLWTGILGGTAYGVAQASRIIPGKTSTVKKVSSSVASWGKNFAKNTKKNWTPRDTKAMKIGGLATLGILGANYILSRRTPGEYEQDDKAEPIGSSLNQRMTSMNAGGDLNFGLFNKRHG